MNKLLIIFLLLLSSPSFSAVDTTTVDTISVEMIQDSNDISVDNDLEKNLAKSDSQEESPYDYNQLFMFGFLVLGAALVVWKFKNNN